MKKIIAFLLSTVLLLLCGCTPTNTAPSETMTDDITTEEAFIEYEPEDNALGVVHSKLSENDLEILKNTRIYEKKLRKEMIEGMPIMKLYSRFSWSDAIQGLEKIKELNEQLGEYYTYIVFYTPILRLQALEKDDSTKLHIIRSYDSYKPPIFLNDLKRKKKTDYFLGNECTIESIYCIDASNDHYGIIVYFETDKGVYVTYYKNERSQGFTFKEKDFKKYADSFCYYVANQSINGDPIMHSAYNYFIEYLRDFYPTTVESWPKIPKSDR